MEDLAAERRRSLRTPRITLVFSYLDTKAHTTPIIRKAPTPIFPHENFLLLNLNVLFPPLFLAIYCIKKICTF